MGVGFQRGTRWVLTESEEDRAAPCLRRARGAAVAAPMMSLADRPALTAARAASLLPLPPPEEEEEKPGRGDPGQGGRRWETTAAGRAARQNKQKRRGK